MSNIQRGCSNKRKEKLKIIEKKNNYSSDLTNISNNEINLRTFTSNNTNFLKTDYNKILNTINSKKDMYIEENYNFNNEYNSNDSNEKCNLKTNRSNKSNRSKMIENLNETNNSTGRKILIKGMSNLLNSPNCKLYDGKSYNKKENKNQLRNNVKNLIEILNNKRCQSLEFFIQNMEIYDKKKVLFNF